MKDHKRNHSRGEESDGLLYGLKTDSDSDGPDCVFQLDTITIGLRTIEESIGLIPLL